MKIWMLAPLAGLLLLTGCSTTSMKGTPFYTGEYEGQEGPASDRVNLWPIVYYRDPALAVLWPIMEFSPDHLAVRPVYSIYDRESDTPVYNVVWPIGRFDTATGENRVFPVYWGTDYGVVFPLYWHKGDPVSGTGYNSLFPLWIWNNKESGSSLHVMWPLYAHHDYDALQGWRLWPIYSTKSDRESCRRYWLWPLGHAYTDAVKNEHAFVPFYYYNRSDEQLAFATLLYGRSSALQPGGLSWDYTVPLWYRAWSGNTLNWTIFPALSWGKTDGTVYDNNYLLGLVRSAETEESRAHHVLPFYYHSRTADASAFYSLPWWSNRATDGTGWSASFPFYYGSRSVAGSIMVTPVYARKHNPDGSNAWKCYIPLVYLDESKDAHFMTLLGGRWRMDDESRWIALPLLSWGRTDAESGRNIWMAGVAGNRWDENGSSHYALPFYWWEQNQAFYTALYGNNSRWTYYLTPLAGRYTGADTGSWVFPFYRHLKEGDGDVHNSYLLLGKYDNEKKRKAHRFWPLFDYEWFRWNTWETSDEPGAVHKETDRIARESKKLSYLLFGKNSQRWDYESIDRMNTNLLSRYREKKSFWPLFSRKLNQFYDTADRTSEPRRGSRNSNTLILAWSRENWNYAAAGAGDESVWAWHRKRNGVFPLWKHDVLEEVQKGRSEKTSSYLGFLYDTHREKQSGEKEHDYLRRRVLWRLYHHEKLNGDSSTDVFPGITVDSYRNGCYKCSVFWRLFRYEKNPEAGEKKLDLLFIPLRR